MYGTIVVPLDRSPFAERALAPAVELALADHARLLLLSAADDDETNAYLHTVAAGLDFPATVVCNEDDEPALAIAAVAAPDTLVCMASHGRGGVRRAMLGSVAEGVLRSATDPVLICGPDLQPDRHLVGGRLMVCLDGSERAEAILQHAVAWAKAFEMEVWLTSVMNPDAGAPPWDRDADVLESGYLARLAQGVVAHGVQVEWDVLHGPDVAGRLVDAATRLPAAAIALTTHGRTGLKRAVVGSVAMDVAHGAPCPVLIARSV